MYERGEPRARLVAARSRPSAGHNRAIAAFAALLAFGIAAVARADFDTSDTLGFTTLADQRRRWACRINARDGWRDIVRCGTGLDRARPDSKDVVADSCEQVSVGPG
jgi:hypothetical protein